MRYKYSKPSGDSSPEGANIISQEHALQKIIEEVTARISTYPERTYCLLCGEGLQNSDTFKHRDILFKHCNTCGHMQTLNAVDHTYEQAALKALGYKKIYPAIDVEAYKSRCERIYKPKAQWIFESIKDISINPKCLKWCDIDCGAGYFLKSLQDLGCHKIQGVDIDEHNLRIAGKMVGEGILDFNSDPFERTFTNIDADIYTAFFVLEHIASMNNTIKALKTKNTGTFFAFSVPTFGFIAMFESIVKDHYPRCLDAMMHTQIYTEQSLAYLLNEAGYEVISEWVFGQDTMDIHRFMSTNLAEQYPEKLYQSSMNKIKTLIDPLQSVIDQAHFADARHILAVKR